ncbi:MAG: radical SAM protein [Chloracidobacterium sp.]|nr:radical SAM protein [Chloracidobacterium sp.]
MNWQLNKIQYPVYNLGPGKRIGIWVQGCNLGCSGCVNKTTWNKHAGQSIPVLDVFNWAASLEADYDGITISGGEPFQQYESLITFLHLVKSRTKYDTYCYSGYYLDEIELLFPDKLFCRYLDFLVDGRYIRTRHEDKNQKGSSNQTLYKFIDGRPVKQKALLSSNKWSVHVNKSNRIYMAGIPKKLDLAEICIKLRDVGIEKTFK